MKIRMIAILLLVLVGFGALFYVGVSDTQTVSDYNAYLKKARQKADENIPYVAIQNYMAAMEINDSDMAVYLEYLKVLKDFEGGNYGSSLRKFINKFPQSSVGYELLCEEYLEYERYSSVIDTYKKALDSNVQSEKLEEIYNQVAYKYKYLKRGFETAGSFRGGIALIKVKGKYGYYSNEGGYLIEPTYDDAGVFFEGRAPVKFNDKYMFINTSGYKVAVPNADIDSMGIAREGKIAISIKGKYGYMDTSLIVPDKLNWDYASTYSQGIAAVCSKGKWGLIDINENPITDLIYDDIKINEYNMCITQNIVFAKKTNKYIMLDVSGKQIGSEEFDDVFMFCSAQPTAFKKGEKWGFVRTDGTIAIEPRYIQAKSYCISLAPAFDGAKWGYVTSKGEWAIEPTFDDCNSFTDNGVAAVKEGDQWGYIQLYTYIQ